MKLLARSHYVISVVEAELELEADRQPLPVPNGDKSFLIRSNMGQLPHHEFSNISGLFGFNIQPRMILCSQNTS